MKKKKAPVYKYNYANGGQFGDFMQSNAGSIGSLVGGGIGLAFGVPQVGAALGGAAGNAIQGNYQQNEAQDANMDQINAQNRSLALTNYNNRQQTSPAYGANFASGGNMSGEEFQAYRDPNTPLNSINPALQVPQNRMNLAIQNRSGMNTQLPTPQNNTNLSRIPFNAPNYTGRPVQQLPNNIPQANQLDPINTSLTGQFQKNFQTHNYRDVPTSIPRGQRINPELVSRARMEKSRNNAIDQFVTKNSMAGNSARQQGNGQSQYGAIQTMMGYPQNLQQFGNIIDNPVPTRANGGPLNTSKLDNITVYPDSAGTHEQSSLGGIPLGKKGKVEKSEVRYKNYIFSDRF